MTKLQVNNSGLLLLFSGLLLLSVSTGWSKKRDTGLNFSNAKTDPSFRSSFAAASDINDTSWLKYEILYTFTSKPADAPLSGWTFDEKRFEETTRSKRFQIPVHIRTVKRPEMDAEKFIHLESKSVDLSKVLKDTKNATTNVSLIKPTNLSINPKLEIVYTSLIKIVTETLNKMIDVRTDVESVIPVDGKVLISNMSFPCHETDKFNKILLQSLIIEESIPTIKTNVTISLGLKTTTETPSRKFDIFMKIDMTEKPIKVYVISKDLELRKPSPSKSFLLGNTKVSRKPKPLSLNQVLTQLDSTMNSTLPICLEFEATLTSINPLIDKLNLMLSDSGKLLFQSKKLNNKRGNRNDDITLFRAQNSNYFPTENITNKTDVTVNQKVAKLLGVKIPLRIVKVKTSQKRTSNISAEPTTATSYEMTKETVMNTPRLKYQYTTENISFDSSSRHQMPVESKIGAQDISTEKSPAVLSVAVHPKINLRDVVLMDTSPVMTLSVARESLSTKLSPLSTDPKTTKDIVLNEFESIIDAKTIDPELTLNYFMPIKTDFNDTSLKLAEISKSVSKPQPKIIGMSSNHQSTSTIFVQKELQNTENRKILQNNGFRTAIADKLNKETGLEKQLLTKLLIPTKFKSTINSAISGKSLALTDSQTTSVNVISKASINDKVSSKIPAYVAGKILQNVYTTENVESKQPVNISELTGNKHLSQRVLSMRPTSRKRTAQWREGKYIAVSVTTSNSSYTNVTSSRDVFHYAHLNPTYKITNYTTTAVPSRNTEHRTAAVTSRSIATREITEDLGDSHVLMPSKSSPYIEDKWTTEEPQHIDAIVPFKKSEHIALLAISKEDTYSKKTATSKNLFTPVNKKSEYLGYVNVTLSRDEYTTFNVTSEEPNYAPITESSEENEYIITTSKESPYTKESKCNNSSETAEFQERFTKIKAIFTELADINLMALSKSEYTNSSTKDYTRLIASFKDSDQTIITASSNLTYTNEAMPFKNKSSKTIPVQPTNPNVTVSAKENEYTIINATSAQSRYSNAKAPSKDSELTTVITSMKTSYTNGTPSSKESKHAVINTVSIQSTCSDIEAISNYSKYRMNSTYEPSYTRVTATSKNEGATYESSSASVRTPPIDDEYTTSKVRRYISMMTSPKKSKQSTFIATSSDPSFTNVTTELKDNKNTTVISTSAKPTFTEVALPKESEHTSRAISKTLYGSVTAISNRRETSSNVTSEKLYANVTALSEEIRYARVNVTLNENSYTNVTIPPKEIKRGLIIAVFEESRYNDTTVPFKESENTTDYRLSEKSSYTNGTESSKTSKHAIINAISIQSAYSNVETITSDSKYKINSTYEPSHTTLKAAPPQGSKYTTLQITSKFPSYTRVTATLKNSEDTTNAIYDSSSAIVRTLPEDCEYTTSKGLRYISMMTSPKKSKQSTFIATSSDLSFTNVTTQLKDIKNTTVIAATEKSKFTKVALPKKSEHAFHSIPEILYGPVTAIFKRRETSSNVTSEKLCANVTASSKEIRYATVNVTLNESSYTDVTAPLKEMKRSSTTTASEESRYNDTTVSLKESKNTTDYTSSEKSRYTNGTESSKTSKHAIINTVSIQSTYSNAEAKSNYSKYRINSTYEPRYTSLKAVPSQEREYTLKVISKLLSYTRVIATSKDSEYTTSATYEPSYSNVRVPSKESGRTHHAPSIVPSDTPMTSSKKGEHSLIIATSKEPRYTNITLPFKESNYTIGNLTSEKSSYTRVTVPSNRSEYRTIIPSDTPVTTSSKNGEHRLIIATSKEPRYTNITLPFKESNYTIGNLTSEKSSYTRVTVPSNRSEYRTIIPSDIPVTRSSKKGEHSLIRDTPVTRSSKKGEHSLIIATSKEPRYTNINLPFKESNYTIGNLTSEKSSYTRVTVPSNRSEYRTIISTPQTLTRVRAPYKGTEYSTFYATSKTPGYTHVTISSEESDNRTVTATLKESSYTNGTVSSNKSERTIINATSVQLAYSNITATSKVSKYTTLKTTYEPSYPDLRSPSHESEYTVINTPSVESNFSVVTAISKDSEYTTSHVTCKEPSYSLVTATSGKEHTSFSGYATFDVISKESSSTDVAPLPFKKIGHEKINAINVISEEPGYNNVTVTSMTSKYSSDPAVWVENESATGTITLTEGEGTTGRALLEEGKSERSTEIEEGDYTSKRKPLENEYHMIKMKSRMPSYTNGTLSPATNTSVTPLHTTSNIFLRKLICYSNVSCKDTAYKNVMSEQLHYATISVTPMEPNYTKRILSRTSKYSDIKVITAENGHLEEKMTSKKPEYLLKNLTEMKETLSTTNASKQESYITQTETLKTPSFSVGYLTLQQSYSFTSINGTENATSRYLHSLEETVRISTFPPVNTLSTELSSISIALEIQNSTVSIVYSETKEMINSGLIAGIVIAIAIVISLMTSFLIFVVKKRNTNEELEIENPVYRQKVDV
ncbi:uncharacterized protein LOC143249186 [Tachypleus tridentatus]|uniref:uncharacterized protein LOC143249186 n=1 Tax=Tachypleus tridentatus TaxID=6853 RepID=UPI003FCFE9DE